MTPPQDPPVPSPSAPPDAAAKAADAALLDTIDRMPDDAPLLETGALRQGRLDDAPAAALSDYLRALPQLPKVGSVIAERWRIERMLGEGGFGAVFEGRDQQLGRKVAIKVMRGEARAPADADELRAAITRIEERRRRFHDEARAVARAESPNVVTVYDVGEQAASDGGATWPFLVLELVEGTPLDQIVRARPTPEAALHIFEQLVQGVMTLHARRVVHRDLKPANAILTHDGRVKIIDFGLAIAASDWTEVRGPKAPEDWIEGTPIYMSPEVTAGGEPDLHSDLWALGVIAYELLSGRSPWGEHLTLAELERRIAHVEPAPLAPRSAGDVPWLAHLTPIIFKMLAKRPADRFQSAADIAEALAELRAQTTRASSTASSPASSRDGEQPFRYLLAFEEKDAGWFFGREEVTARLVLALEQRGRLVIAGPSGAGKTSVIQAGLIPELKVLRPLEVLRMMPGRDPLARLAALLASAGVATTADEVRARPGLVGEALRAHARATKKRVLVLVDALEELVTQEAAPPDVEAFAQALEGLRDDSGRAVLLVMAVRDEYLGRLPRLTSGASGASARGPVGLEPMLRDAEFLAPPSRAAMIMALVRPVRRLGATWQEGFPEEMVDAVQGQASPLPVLQLAASWVWEKRAGAVLERRLLAADGEALRIGDVLGQYADAKLRAASWSSADRELVKRLLPVLVSGEGTPLVVPIDDMLARVPAASRARAQELLRDLTDFRLLTSLRDEAAREALTPVHTTLIKGWGLMREALEGSAELEGFLRRFERDARDWEASGRDPAKLWPDAALRDFMRWASHLGTVALSPAQAAFREGVRRQAKKARVVRLGAVVLLALLALGGAWAGFTFSRQADEAEALRADAEAQKTVALEQRAVAEAQTRAATERREEADELIDFMLGDLRVRLVPIRQVKVLRAVAEKALAYLDERAAKGAATPEDAARRAQVLRHLGASSQEEGDTAAAEKAYRDAIAITSELVKAKPDDFDAQHDHGNVLVSLGGVLLNRGDPAGALEAYKSALLQFEKLQKANPLSWDATRDLILVHDRLGDSFTQLGEFDAAYDAYLEALRGAEHLTAQAPDDEPTLRDLSVILNKVSAALNRRGDFAGARTHRERQLAIAQKLAADPNNVQAQHDLAIAYVGLGDVQANLGDEAGALASYLRGEAIDEALVKADPASAFLKRDLAVSHNKVGSTLGLKGDLAGAVQRFTASLALVEALAEADPSNTVYQSDVMYTLSSLSTPQLMLGQRKEALASRERVLELAEALNASPTTRSKFDLAYAHYLVAEALPPEAKARRIELARRGREVLAPLLAQPGAQPSWKSVDDMLAQLAAP